MNIAVDGKNCFCVGWATRFLGLPRTHPHAKALKEGDLAAFLDGWDMCDETPESGRPNRTDAFYAEILAGNISVFWVDDDNNEMPVSWEE